MSAAFQHWSATHCGRVRTTNDDAHLCRPEIGLFAVADGVGSSAAGGHAARAVMEALETIPSGVAASGLLGIVRTRITEAHHHLLAAAEDHAERAGATTVVALMLHGDHLACLWAGDSRAYLLRDGALHALTADHSLVGEMQRAGRLTEAQAAAHPQANVITRAVGVECEGPLLDKSIARHQPGDRLLICSDGLIKAVPPPLLTTLLLAPDPADALVAAALDRDARDNVTAVVIGRERDVLS